MPLPVPFPNIKLNYESTDANPAVQLFGRRFFSDQTVLEYLVEFLLVGHSKKKLSDRHGPFNTFFPPWEYLKDWTSEELLYLPPLRLCLKLFAFLGSSKLETRHVSHREQYHNLLKCIEQKIRTDGTIEKDDILRTLENLFLGFQGAGFDRTWCAQTFLPISSSLLGQEIIWNESEVKRQNSELSWHDLVYRFKKYFSVSRHRFLARGGELLYLQVCNALRFPGPDLTEFCRNFSLRPEESDPKALHEALEQHVWQITGQTPRVFDQIAELIDKADGFTTQELEALKGEDDWVACGWCPEESRPEGYLFAVELLRLCRAALDPVERIELLSIGCALQVLRSLCAQSVRYAVLSEESRTFGGGLGYAWIISDPEGKERRLKHLSQRNLQVVQRIIYQALRHEEIRKGAKENLYREADTRYGHKLFLSLAKKIGFVVPQRGPGARFVFDDKILRYLVFALVPPGHRVTYDEFRAALYAHYGIAIEGPELERAVAWSELPPLGSAAVHTGKWLSERLRASGFLVHLSDACSLVHNPFGGAEPDRSTS